MKERPILFSGPMVRATLHAILQGDKTQTRRVVKSRKGWPIDFIGGIDDWDDPSYWGFEGQDGFWYTLKPEKGDRQIPCLYGRPGDMLWVREGHYFFEDKRIPEIGYSPENLTREDVIYQADADEIQCPWRSPIHMPRWASRITLEITSVRVERLQNFSESDALAEGIKYNELPNNGRARTCYRGLWEQINGPGSWNKNPFVWVIEFKRVV